MTNLAGLVEPLVYMSRAYEESETKSRRVKEAWANKRKQLADPNGKKLTAHCSGWLELSRDRTHYTLRPKQAEIVRRICRMALDGFGITAIVKTLNAETIPSVGRSKTGWHKAFVRRILANRVLIGEYQPCTGHNDTDRKPAGKPIVDYFPRLISDHDFYRIQTLMRGSRGKVGKCSPNLFAGLLFDARDGQTITLTSKKGRSQTTIKTQRQLVNSSAQRGMEGAVYASFPYGVLEQVLIRHYLPELKITDLAPETANTDTDDLEGKIADLDHRIGTITKRLAREQDLDPLLDILSSFTKERQTLQAELEHQTEAKHQETLRATLQDCRRLTDLTDEDTRRRLKAKLKRIIKRIEMRIEKKGIARVARVAMVFHNGKSRVFAIAYRKGQFWHRWVDGDKTETMGEYFAWAERR